MAIKNQKTPPLTAVLTPASQSSLQSFDNYGEDNEDNIVDNINNTFLTLGKKLRQAREAKNLTPEAIAKQLFVGKQLIIDLENDDYRGMGASVYARGHLISYAKLLHLEVEPLLAEFAKLTQGMSAPVHQSMPLAQATTFHDGTEPQRHWFFYVAIIIITITLVLWGYNHYKQYKYSAAENLAKTSAVAAVNANAPDNISPVTSPQELQIEPLLQSATVGDGSSAVSAQENNSKPKSSSKKTTRIPLPEPNNANSRVKISSSAPLSSEPTTPSSAALPDVSASQLQLLTSSSPQFQEPYKED